MKDIEIAQQAKMKKISDIAATIGLAEDEYEQYGKYKAKVSIAALEKRKNLDD